MDEDEINRLRIAIGRISRRVNRQVSGAGMTTTQMGVLATLVRMGRIGMSELADAEGLNPTMTSRIVGKLEAAGLVAREQGADDRRSVLVAITPAGSRLQTRLRRERTALFAQRLAELPAAQRRSLLAVVPALEGLADAMRGAEPMPAPPARVRAEAVAR